MSSRETSDTPEAGTAHDPLDQERVSGAQASIAYRITAWREGYAQAQLEVEDKHLNRSRRVHGGIFALLIDAVTGYCGCYCPYPGRIRRAVTLSLTVNYLGQPRGRKLIASARKTGGGRSVFFSEAELRDEHGTLLATGVGTFRYRSGSRDPMGEPVEALRADGG